MTDLTTKNNESDQENEKRISDPILDKRIGSFGVRLKALLDKEKLSKRMFANLIGVTETSIRNYEKGRFPQIDIATKMANALNVSLEELIYGETIFSKDKGLGCATVTVDEFNEEYVLIPGYHVSVSTGHGALNDGAEVKRQLAFRYKWLRYRKLNARDLAVVFAQGDSMEPTIHNGNSILVDLSDTQLKDGSIYVLRFGQELYAKRLQKRFDGSVCLISDNKEYDDQIVKENELEQLAIIGKVVWIGKDLY